MNLDRFYVAHANNRKRKQKANSGDIEFDPTNSFLPKTHQAQYWEHIISIYTVTILVYNLHAIPSLKFLDLESSALLAIKITSKTCPPNTKTLWDLKTTLSITFLSQLSNTSANVDTVPSLDPICLFKKKEKKKKKIDGHEVWLTGINP